MKPRLLYLLLIAGKPLFAQTSKAALEQRSLDSAIHAYQNDRGDALEIYSGMEYAGQLPGEGTPFVDNKGWNPGDLIYNGRLYHNILLRYEAMEDVLVIVPASGFRTMSLYSPRVSWFNSNGRDYIYLDSLKYANLPRNGFYGLLVNGPKMELLKRTQKYLKETAEATGIRREFEERDWYYITRDGKLEAVKNEKELFKIMGTKAATVKSALKKEKVKFKRAPEYYLTQAVTLYNQLP